MRIPMLRYYLAFKWMLKSINIYSCIVEYGYVHLEKPSIKRNRNGMDNVDGFITLVSFMTLIYYITMEILATKKT